MGRAIAVIAVLALVAIYAVAVRGGAAPLPPVPPSADFVASSRTYFGGPGDYRCPDATLTCNRAAGGACEYEDYCVVPVVSAPALCLRDPACGGYETSTDPGTMRAYPGSAQLFSVRAQRHQGADDPHAAASTAYIRVM